MIPTLSRICCCLAALLLLALPTAAQDQDVGVGGGREPTVFASPGLEARTPSAEPLAMEDVELLIPHDGHVTGRVSIPDDRLGVLVQPEGRTWRAFRIQGLFWTAAGAILATLAALTVFYLWRGSIRIESGRSGRWIPRFAWFERFTHWLTALSFLSLALTGLIITFGRYLLIPLMGHHAYSPLAEASKYVHNASGVPFTIGIVLMLVLWVRDNIPNRDDITWLRQMGGVFSKPGTPHPEAGRFNAGQKAIFWIVVLGGMAVAVTGFVLMTPFTVTGIMGMQLTHAVHALLAVVLIAVIIVHIYLGSLGMEGAFDAMSRGEVDENWAREHHSGWYKARNAAKADTTRDPAGKTTPAE